MRRHQCRGRSVVQFPTRLWGRQMKRRDFLKMIGGAAAWPATAAAQRREFRITLVSGLGEVYLKPYLALIMERLARGGIEPEKLTFDVPPVSGNTAYDRTNIENALARKPDAILALGPVSTGLARAVTPTIPIIFVWVSDPVVEGIVKNYARPGGNSRAFPAASLS